MLLAPFKHCTDNGQRRFAQFGNGVFRPRRQLGEDSLCHKSVLHHLLELDVEHARRRFGQSLVYFARTHFAAQSQLVKYAGFPFRLDKTHCQSQRTVEINRYFCVAEKPIAGKKMGLICCCEEHDRSVMDGVRIPMERTAALLKWDVAGEVLVPGVFVEGDIEKTDGCAQAAALADKF